MLTSDIEASKVGSPSILDSSQHASRRGAAGAILLLGGAHDIGGPRASSITPV